MSQVAQIACKQIDLLSQKPLSSLNHRIEDQRSSMEEDHQGRSPQKPTNDMNCQIDDGY
jgi:hypothetical protein